MSKFFEPVYIDAVVIGEVEEEMRDAVREDCQRAFYGRLGDLSGRQYSSPQYLATLTCSHLYRPAYEISDLPS